MKKYKIGTLFPNTNESLGYYSPMAFCITLNTINDQMLRLIKPDTVDYIVPRKILYHEMRHNIDHLSTLWGQNRILNLFRATNGRLSNDENKFSSIVDYKIEENQFHFDKYYTVQYNRVAYNSPKDSWGWEPSSGIRFDDLGKPNPQKPIPFINFLTQSGTRIVRVPISIAALLETNAVSEETLVESQYLDTLSEAKMPKEKQVYQNRLFKTVIYNQDMALYNATVHLCANILNVYDVYTAFKISSSIATIVLNLPINAIKSIPIDRDYFAAWGDRPDHFINNQNYGFLYLVTLHNYRENFKKTGQYNVEEFLQANLLPNKSILEKTIIDEFEKIPNMVTPDCFFYKFFQQQLLSGMNLFKLRGIDGTNISLKETIISGKYFPFIITKNTSFKKGPTFKDILRTGIVDDISINDWYYLARELSEMMQEFFTIRGL
jgi:hypothetical protein